MHGMDAKAVRDQVARIVSTPTFSGSERLCEFLRFVTDEVLQGRGPALKEYVIGVRVYGRKQDYDPKVDAIVRVEAGRLRSKLAEYYAGPGATHSIRIELPRGTYAPVFRESPAPAATPDAPPSRVTRLRGGVLAFGAIVAMLAIVAMIVKAKGGRSDATSLSIAVLPFDDLTPAPGMAHFADGLSDQLTHRLASEPGFQVASRTAAFQFRGRAGDLKGIGTALGVSSVIEGSVQRNRDRTRITAQLVTTTDGFHLWSQSYESEDPDLLHFQDAVCLLIARTLRANFAGDGLEAYHRRTRRNPTATELYIKGHEEWLTQRLPGMVRAIAFYEQAIGKDSRYSEAHSGLAAAMLYQAGIDQKLTADLIPKVKAEATRAIALDDRLPEPHAVLANVLLFHDWNFADAEREFQRAIELQPGVSAYTRWYSLAGTLRMHLQQVLEELQGAELANPDSEVIEAALGDAWFALGDLDKAAKYAARSLQILPTYPPAIYLTGRIEERRGRYSEAGQTFGRCAESREWEFDCTGSQLHALALAGDGVAAQAGLQGLTRQTSIALVKTVLNDRDAALAALESAYSGHEIGFPYVARDPRYSSLHDTPRYRELMRRMGL